MSKKHWISVKRGLSEDPKHRQAMGEAIWLFLHMIDAAEWETGIVYDWRDKDIAIDMSLSTATVRGWRDRLVKGGYITCKQGQHSLEVTIHNWIDPRNYSGKRLNLSRGDTHVSPSKKEESPDMGEGESQDDTQVPDAPIVNPTPFIESPAPSPSNEEQYTNSKAEKYWSTIDTYLRSEMPRSLHKYLDGCVPLQWEGSTLTVQAQDAEWLDQHVGKLAKRFLVGMAQGGAVEFVA